MKNLFLFFVLAFSFAASAQQTDILFLGNSYTYTADLPGTLYNLAQANGRTIYHESNTPGGYTFEGHSTNATSLNKIASRDWDFVVLQEQSQIPSFPPSQVESDCYPYAQILVDSIRSNYECSEPIFFMTWGRQNGDPQNCQFYPPLCTFEGMNARLRESYLEMGANNEATVAPCGAAWHQMFLQDNFFWGGLYSGDGSHPSAWGTYLNACVFYATIFRESPVGIPYYSSIGQEDAEDLQQLAEDMVLDSLSTWYIGHGDVVSNAYYSVNSGLNVNFSGSSLNATDHFWDFGDGNTSELENLNHTYVSANTYTVTHIASSNCDADTTYLEVTVNVLPNGVSDLEKLESIVIQQIDGSVRFNNPLTTRIQITLLDPAGRMVMEESVAANTTLELSLSVASGVYLVRLSGGMETIAKKILIN